LGFEISGSFEKKVVPKMAAPMRNVSVGIIRKHNVRKSNKCIKKSSVNRWNSLQKHRIKRKTVTDEIRPAERIIIDEECEQQLYVANDDSETEH
jgi:hypothetical protein